MASSTAESSNMLSEVLDFLQGSRGRGYVEQAKRVIKESSGVFYVHIGDLPPRLRVAVERKLLRVTSAFQSALASLAHQLADPQLQSRGVGETCLTVAVAFGGVGPPSKLRDLRSERLGQLVAIRGVVRRVAETRPERLSGDFVCGACGHVVRTYADCSKPLQLNRPTSCPAAGCKSNGKWTLQEDSPSTCWSQWQALRVQEHPEETPGGTVPRVVDVVLRGAWCGEYQVGDQVRLTGCLAAVPAAALSGGARAQLQQDAPCKIAFLCSCAGDIPACVRSGADGGAGEDEICRSGRNLLGPPSASQSSMPDGEPGRKGAGTSSVSARLQELAQCVAPSVHGHVDAKIGILLMLLGGVARKTATDPDRVRSEIHVCLFGPASSAKSTLLRWAASFLPRGVYVDGAGASAAGLTASYDVEEACLRPGALVGAAGGVCCIDNLDRMRQPDQDAISEAMEAQQISFCKAGLQTKLQVAASVVAACSTPDGHRARSGTVSSSLLGRFDLLIAMEGSDGDAGNDEEMARYILALACGEKGSSAVSQQMALERHIKRGRALSPRLSAEAGERAKHCYLDVRKLGGTARHFQSLLRLAEAVARACLQEEVSTEHIEVAMHLVAKSLTAPVAQVAAAADGRGSHARRPATAPLRVDDTKRARR